LKDALATDLRAVRSAGLWRELREVESAQEASVVLRGRQVLLFCSNNYLGLANHPEVVEASREAALRFGASAGSSRLISGHMAPHRLLEEQLAEWKPREHHRCDSPVAGPRPGVRAQRHERAGRSTEAVRRRSARAGRD
jgi:7-keto-8-aminopelargonate synthetase-like enzyme